MASVINGFIKADELKRINQNKLIHGQKGVRIPITILVNDESRYGNNVTFIVSQSSEERDAKAEKHYLGNGSVVWTDGNIKKGEKDQENGSSEPQSMDNILSTPEPSGEKNMFDDLPF